MDNLFKGQVAKLRVFADLTIRNIGGIIIKKKLNTSYINGLHLL